MQRINAATIFLLAIAFWGSQSFAQSVPDFSVNLSNAWRVDVYSNLSPLTINTIHSWRLKVTDSAGQPVEDVTVQVAGGMPDHDHGLPTQPQVTAEIATGEYLLEGVRFHMPGRWRMDFIVEAGNAIHRGFANIEL